MKDLQREITEYLSCNTEDPMDVVKDVALFIDRIMSRNTYAIFQSNFGFLDTDTPFTMIISTDSNEYTIDYWAWDWSTFDIMSYDYIHLADMWKTSDRLQKSIPNIEDLTAREIVEHENCWDRKDSYRSICGPGSLQATVTSLLVMDYGLDDEDEYDEPYNPRTSGIVAVVYREPLK